MKGVGSLMGSGEDASVGFGSAFVFGGKGLSRSAEGLLGESLHNGSLECLVTMSVGSPGECVRTLFSVLARSDGTGVLRRFSASSGGGLCAVSGKVFVNSGDVESLGGSDGLSCCSCVLRSYGSVCSMGRVRCWVSSSKGVEAEFLVSGRVGGLWGHMGGSLGRVGDMGFLG